MIIAISNQKGGQGKTTTAQALAAGAAMKGRSVLAVDLDPQSNLTFSMGGDATAAGAYEVLTGQAKATQAIQTTPQGDLLAASNELAGADYVIQGDRKKALTTALKPLKGIYDHIVIDCPPALNILLINALTAADRVIIPLTSDMYSLQGLYQLVQTIHEAQQVNNALEIGGVLFVKHNRRTILSRDLTEIIAENCKKIGIPVYDTTIREGVAIREAQTYRQSIFEYAPRSNPARDYMQLIDEIGL